MFCDKCGAQIPENSVVCPACGAQVGSGTQNYQQPSPQYGYAQPPVDTSVLTMGNYIVMMLIMCIPIVNIIMLFVWGFGSNVNLNKRNYARASLIFTLIGIFIAILFSCSMVGLIGSLGYYYY